MSKKISNCNWNSKENVNYDFIYSFFFKNAKFLSSLQRLIDHSRPIIEKEISSLMSLKKSNCIKTACLRSIIVGKVFCVQFLTSGFL